MLRKKMAQTRSEDVQGRPWFDVALPKHFVVPPKTWAFCLRNLYRRRHTLIIGPTGCGKTELVAHLAAATGRVVYPVNMGATTDPRAVLVGTTHFRDGQTTFYESRFIAGLQDPQGYVLLDEINRATDEANNILGSVSEVGF